MVFLFCMCHLSLRQLLELVLGSARGTSALLHLSVFPVSLHGALEVCGGCWGRLLAARSCTPELGVLCLQCRLTAVSPYRLRTQRAQTCWAEPWLSWACPDPRQLCLVQPWWKNCCGRLFFKTQWGLKFPVVVSRSFGKV